ncbi:MAG: SGNH/GDSL hydrolase family protein [Patescibacteria group bacterium]
MRIRIIKSRTSVLGASIFFLILIGLYLNRAYARIYDTIGGANLTAVSSPARFTVDIEGATSSLNYVALGDSLSAGVGTEEAAASLPRLLAGKMLATRRDINLENYAVPGYRTADLLISALPNAIAARPDIITVLIGVNDIHNQVAAAEFRKNYDLILKGLTTETAAKIYAINLPFIGAGRMMWPPYQFYFDARTREFNGIIRELAVKYQVSYIDLYTPTVSLFKKSGEHYSADLFHPSAAGYRIWADIIYDRFYH